MSQPTLAASTTPQQSANVGLHPALVWVGLSLLALLPRVLHLGIFVTDDEVNFWLQRSETFLHALLTGDPAATAISTHPGVMTMWLGSIGILLRRGLVAAGFTESVDFPLLLGLMQLPVALAHTAAILIGYALLRRLVGEPIALLGAVFWAADPFIIAYSRLLHVDALMMSGATLSVLLLACWLHSPRPHWLIAAAAAAAVAVLSKSPGVILVPFAGLVVLATRWQQRGTGGNWFGLAARDGLIWGATYGTVLLLLYPALWAAPMQVLDLFKAGVTAEGAQPHQTGNYYMGRIDPVPGWHFYLVAIAMRLTPWTLIGLLLLPLVWRQARLQPTHRTLLLLGLFALLFTLAMSGFPKKFNRYIVPVFPALDILAAAGIIGALGWLGASKARARTSGQAVRRFERGILAALMGIAALNAAYWHPYPIVAYNQMLGGARAGVWMFSSGWGEGYDQIAAWLNQQADITGVVTASVKANGLNPYLQHGAQAITPPTPALPDNTGYVVVYAYQTQGTVFPPFDQFYPRATPLHTVTLHGVTYARIYQVPPEVQHRLATRFGEGIVLRGYSLHRAAPDLLDLTVQWQTTAAPPQDYLLFAHLYDQQGQKLAQIDVPPAGPDTPLMQWEPVRAYTWRHPLPIPADLPAGDYWLALGLYDPANFARLPLDTPLPNGAPDAGGNALLLPITLAGAE